MMHGGILLAVIGLLLLGLPLCSAFAQSTENNAKSAAEADDDTKNIEVSEINESHNEKNRQEEYASALDGSGLISLIRERPIHYIIGATFGGGWDSNPENRGRPIASALYTLSPYIGIQANNLKVRSLIQYQYTNTMYSANYTRQSRHVASIGILGNINERWSWDLKSTGSYGQDAIRFLGNQQSVAVGSVPGIGASSAAYAANAGTMANLEGSAAIKYKPSEVDSITVRASNAYSHYLGFNATNKIATININYGKDISPFLGINFYAQTSSYYGSLNCKSYGGGVGLNWHTSSRTTLMASGGPQMNTSSCGSQQGFAYDLSFGTRISQKSQIYILSGRQATSSYLGPGIWQLSTSGGYQRQIRLHGIASVDIGYVASDTLVAVSSYHGLFFDAAYNHTLGHGLRFSSSYRAYRGDYGGTNFSRNAILFSFIWAPTAGHIFQ